MKKYFYTNGTDKLGPFSFEELTNENFDCETLIWFEGLDQWTPAKEIEELIEILEAKPPIIENQFKPQIFKSKLKIKPEVHKKGYILNFIFSIIDYITAFIAGLIYTIIDQPYLTESPIILIPSTIGILIIPAIIAYGISSKSKSKFSYVFAWTTVISLILAFLGTHNLN